MLYARSNAQMCHSIVQINCTSLGRDLVACIFFACPIPISTHIILAAARMPSYADSERNGNSDSGDITVTGGPHAILFWMKG